MWFCCCRERLVLRTRDGAVWRLWIATSSAGKAIPQTASSMRWRFPSQCARQVGRNSNLAKSSNAPAAASNRAKSGHGIFRNAPICVVLHPFCALCPRVQCVIIPKRCSPRAQTLFARARLHAVKSFKCHFRELHLRLWQTQALVKSSSCSAYKAVCFFGSHSLRQFLADFNSFVRWPDDESFLRFAIRRPKCRVSGLQMAN